MSYLISTQNGLWFVSPFFIGAVCLWSSQTKKQNTYYMSVTLYRILCIVINVYTLSDGIIRQLMTPKTGLHVDQLVFIMQAKHTGQFSTHMSCLCLSIFVWLVVHIIQDVNWSYHSVTCFSVHWICKTSPWGQNFRWWSVLRGADGNDRLRQFNFRMVSG